MVAVREGASPANSAAVIMDACNIEKKIIKSASKLHRLCVARERARDELITPPPRPDMRVRFF